MYETYLQYGLNKKKLMSHLISRVIANREQELPVPPLDPQRPIVKVVNEVIELAAQNYQPQSEDGALANQKSGYFGDYED